jgi:predicted dehydrogenase
MLLWEVIGSNEKVDAPAGFQFKDVMDPRLFPEIRQGYQLQDFIAAIKEDRQPLVPGEEAKKSLALVLAMYESAETGREVR